jgi:hypothetical protein
LNTCRYDLPYCDNRISSGVEESQDKINSVDPSHSLLSYIGCEQAAASAPEATNVASSSRPDEAAADLAVTNCDRSTESDAEVQKETKASILSPVGFGESLGTIISVI